MGKLLAALTVVVVASAAQPTVVSAQARSAAYIVYNDLSPCGQLPYPDCWASKIMKATLDTSGARVDWVRDVPQMFQIREAYVTPDGSALVWFGVSWATGPSIWLHDFESGQTVHAATIHGATFMIGNPRRAEVYVGHAFGISALSRYGVRVFADSTCAFPRGQSISADGTRLAIVCNFQADPVICVFDTATGTLLRQMDGEGVISRDGTEVFVRGDFVAGSFHLRRQDVATGATLLDVPVPGIPNFVVDPTSGDVVAYSGRNFYAMDPVTLAQRWTAVMDQGGNEDIEDDFPVFDGPAGLLYANSGTGVFTVFDTVAQRVLLSASVPRFQEERVALAVGPPAPDPPAGLTFTVQGGGVALSWTPARAGEDTTKYVLEVGSAPGLSNIYSGLEVGPQTSFGASGVPPGTYYVRVRAGNYTGLSAASNEVIVQVP